MTIPFDLKVGIDYRCHWVANAKVAINGQRCIGYCMIPTMLVDSQSMLVDGGRYSQCKLRKPKFPQLFMTKAVLPTDFSSLLELFEWWQHLIPQLPSGKHRSPMVKNWSTMVKHRSPMVKHWFTSSNHRLLSAVIFTICWIFLPVDV